MTTTKKTAKKAPVRKSRKPSTSILSAPEIRKLVLQAKEAHGYQIALRNISADSSFDEFRRDQVMAAVGAAGISKINREEWRPVMAHFLTLSGKEDEAFELLNKTGEKGYRPAGPDDTHESCEALASKIREALLLHGSIKVEHPKGNIGTGWFLVVARQRTGKPSLTMETLSERLDPKTLVGLLSHLRNHIAVREGREKPERRSPRAKRVQQPCNGDSDEPF